MKKVCPLCGTENKKNAIFCKECNEPLYLKERPNNNYNSKDSKEEQPFELISDEEVSKITKKDEEKKQKEEQKKIKIIIKKIRDIWNNFPGKINKKQKIFLAIIIPIAIFFIALSIAYNTTCITEWHRAGGKLTGVIQTTDPTVYMVRFHQPFDWGKTWHIWVFAVVFIFFFEYKLFEDK